MLFKNGIKVAHAWEQLTQKHLKSLRHLILNSVPEKQRNLWLSSRGRHFNCGMAFALDTEGFH